MIWILGSCLLALSRVVWADQTYDNGYWTPSPTYYPPTTAYTSYWTPSTTYTTCYTQNEVIVTITSIIPCPVTSTVVYYTYECDQCQCNDCCDYQNNCCMNQHCYNSPTYYVGTTTATSFTTVPPSPVQTITSNGLVIVVMDTGSYVQSLGATDQVQVINAASSPVRISGVEVGLALGGVLAVAVLMIAL